jgi:hypothetical protein
MDSGGKNDTVLIVFGWLPKEEKDGGKWNQSVNQIVKKNKG